MNDQKNTLKQWLRIPVLELHDTLNGILLKNGFEKEKAETLTKIFVENTCEGSMTHGVTRFPRFIQHVKDKYINIHAEPELRNSIGSIEQWNGRLGPGPLNALFCTRRAMEIASTNGIGCVGLANTNHWMRAGYYARIAAAEGYIFIGWTNTLALMPVWGAKDKRIGNNPLVIGIPYDHAPLVLDMAMSQFSYGTMETKAMGGETLEVPGGYSINGELTDDPSEILASGRPLPIGYWKGSGLAMFLDILAVAFSGGASTKEISARDSEYGVSQVFMSIPAASLTAGNNLPETIIRTIEDIKRSIPLDQNTPIHYPGEHVLRIRKENEKLGAPVDPAIWSEIINMK